MERGHGRASLHCLGQSLAHTPALFGFMCDFLLLPYTGSFGLLERRYFVMYYFVYSRCTAADTCTDSDMGDIAGPCTPPPRTLQPSWAWSPSSPACSAPSLPPSCPAPLGLRYAGLPGGCVAARLTASSSPTAGGPGCQLPPGGVWGGAQAAAVCQARDPGRHVRHSLQHQNTLHCSLSLLQRENRSLHLELWR